MASLSLIGFAANAGIIFVGKPEPTTILDSDGRPYFRVTLRDEISVYCSSDKTMEPLITNELYIREEAAKSEDWKFVDETKPEMGYFMEGWIADFSKGQSLPLYQKESISKWARTLRRTEAGERDEKLRAFIKAKNEQKGK